MSLNTAPPRHTTAPLLTLHLISGILGCNVILTQTPPSILLPSDRDRGIVVRYHAAYIIYSCVLADRPLHLHTPVRRISLEAANRGVAD